MIYNVYTFIVIHVGRLYMLNTRELSFFILFYFSTELKTIEGNVKSETLTVEWSSSR